jgi:hypothetical protein
MFNAFVAPEAGWQKPRAGSALTARPARPSSKPKARDWQDYAGEENWEAAVLHYLREHRRQAVPYWQVVNLVVGESIQPDRWEVRYATRQVLTAIQSLLKTRRIMRFRRTFLAVIDTGDEVMPLERYFALTSRTATGRANADSTIRLEAVKIAQDRH